MQKALLATLVLTTLGGSAHALVTTYRELPWEAIDTPAGVIKLEHMRYLHQAGVYTLLGEVVNDTERGWTELVLTVTLTDKSGPIEMRAGWGRPYQREMQIHLSGIPPRGTQEFKFQAFAKADSGSLAPSIEYGGGDFPVAYRVGLVKPMVSDAGRFETERYAITFSFADKGISFSLVNKGDGPIRIDWNSVAYVTSTGQSQGVIHNGVKLADRTAPKAPTIVPPAASIEDEVVPVDNVELVGMEWVTHSLLPTGPAGLKAIGSQFSIFLPLDVDGKVENRLFVFKVLAAH